MCGICGFVSFKPGTRLRVMCSMLRNLRHRGYDSWGIAQCEQGEISVRTQRYAGQVPSDNDLAHDQPLRSRGDLPSKTHPESEISFAIGHTRYTTRGSHECHSQAQPLVSDNGSIALVHNGQVACPDLEEYGSDTAFIVQVLQDAFDQHWNETKRKESLNRIFQDVIVSLDGAYACIALIAGVGLFAFRDPWGIRPLCLTGTSDSEVLFASESSAFSDLQQQHHLSTTDLINVRPGEVVWIGDNGEMEILDPLGPEANLTPLPCLFEFIYLAHDDSVIDGIHVREAREEMGRAMAPLVKDLEIDVVVPVPHTPVLAGRVLAETLGVDYADLLQVHSRQARRESRTFILPTQTAREQAVRQKFAVRSQIIPQCRGKNILILDDSIVRGTTLRHVVALIRTVVKPTKIYVASLSPPIVAPNRFGIDIPDNSRLIAAVSKGDNNTEDVEDVNVDVSSIGALVAHRLDIEDAVIYQSLKPLEAGLRRLTTEKLAGFENSVFLGGLPIEPS